jgi:hypothetical protein
MGTDDIFGTYCCGKIALNTLMEQQRHCCEIIETDDIVETTS